MRQCGWCSGPIEPTRRADVRFCSSGCRVAQHRAAPPAVLRDRPRWVRWSAAKVPLTVRGTAASSTDPSTWAGYDKVRRSTIGVGVGFVLNGDGLACIDIDHCLHGGRLLPWAAELVESVPATYVEVSPSGTGLHVWGTAEVGAGRRVALEGGGVEVYGTGRYLTVTGRRFREAPATFADLSAVVAGIR